MILSKNAVGNLINRYKAVLGKCRLLNTFGSLALATALVLGSAGMAAAAWDGTTDLTIGSGDELIINESVTLEKILTIDGGTVTVNQSGRIVSGDGGIPSSGQLLVEGGTLTVNGYSDSRDLQITGGTVNVNGIPGKGWRENGLGGYSETMKGAVVASTDGPTLVSGSNTTVNVTSATLFGGAATDFTTAQLKIAGGATVNLNGLSPDDSHTKDFNNAGMLFAGNGTDHANPNLLITDANTVVNITRSPEGSNHGVFNAGVTRITNGATVNVQGGLLLTGYLNTPASEPGKTVAEAIFTANPGYTSVDRGGSILVGDKGHLVLNQGMTLDIAADGALTSTGTVALYQGSTLAYSADGKNVLKGTVDAAGTIQVTDAKLDLTGAIIKELKTDQLAAGQTAGQIAITRTSGKKSDDLARVEMKDTQLATWLANKGSVTVTGDPNNNGLYARLHLGDVAEVATSNIVGVAAGTSLSSTEAAGKVVLYHHGSLQAQNMTLKGAGLTLANTLDETTESRIKVNSLTLKPDTDTDFTLTKGKLFLKGAQGSVLTLAGAGALKVSDTSELKLGEDQNPGGSINANITTDADTSKVEVAQGKWTLADGNTLNVKKGSLKVGGGDTGQAAELNIQGSLKSGTVGAMGHDAGINVMNNGVLSGAASKFVTYTANDDTASILTGLSKIYVANGGMLQLDGLNTVNTQQMLNTKTNLLTSDSSGLISYGKAAIKISDADKGTTDGSIRGNIAEQIGAMMPDVNAEYDASTNLVQVGAYGSFGVNALVFTGNTANVVVEINGNTTLLGNSGQLIATADNKKADVAVAAGKNLNLGYTGATSRGGTLNGNVTLNAGSALNVAAANYTVGDITAGMADNGYVNVGAGGGLTAGNIGAVGATVSSVNADNGALAATGNINAVSMNVTNNGSVSAKGDIALSSAATVTGGSLNAQSLTVGAASNFTNGTQINVGSLNANSQTITVGDAGDAKSTSLMAENLTLGGGSLLIDPAWTADGPNTVTLLNAAGANIDGNVGVGQNSMLTIGNTSSNWLNEQTKAVTNGAGLKQNGVTAAMGLHSAQVLGDTVGDGSGTGYSLVVNGALDNTALSTYLATTPNSATFADNSLLVVTAAAAENAAGALSATSATAATIADGAKLRITDAKVGQKYTVLGDNIAANKGGNGISVTNGWTGSNFSTDSRMIKGSFDAASGELTTALNSSASVYPKLDGELVKVLDNAYTADQVGPGHVNSDMKGVRFLSRATNDNFIGANADLAAKTIESAARIAVAGAVPQMAMAANNAAGAAITQRTSIAQPDGNGLQSVSLNKSDGVNNKGAALWIMPLYQSQNAWGMEAGNYDLKWNGSLGGVALGGDYTFDNALRAGIAFNIGGGYAEGEGDLAKTTNSFNFWGLGAYAGWSMENFGVTADVNYTSTYNKVKQELPGAMQMSDLKSDITAYALSSGLRAEYKFNTQYVDIIPHLGVRYMYVNTDSYDVKSNGTVMRGDETDQNIWTFPIGVTFSKQVETSNGWHVKPTLDLGILPATGDIDAKSKIRFTGTGTKAELDTRTMDYMSYTGGLGLDFGNNNLSFGLNYNIQASEHTTSHGVFGTARYEF